MRWPRSGYAWGVARAFEYAMGGVLIGSHYDSLRSRKSTAGNPAVESARPRLANQLRKIPQLKSADSLCWARPQLRQMTQLNSAREQ
jgi:hypothetical protein